MTIDPDRKRLHIYRIKLPKTAEIVAESFHVGDFYDLYIKVRDPSFPIVGPEQEQIPTTDIDLPGLPKEVENDKG